jgi:uncharacterized protein YndB with AHSA1/START domain
MTSTSSSRTKLLGGFACEWSEGGRYADRKRSEAPRSGAYAEDGESYTAARAQVLKKKTGGTKARMNAATARRAASARYAEIAGMSDASVREATGCNWERWVRTLDRAGAAGKSHREIAKLVAFFGTPTWWTQMVTVGYERIRGLREKGQMRDGGYQVTKSRTFDADVTHVYDAFARASTRKRWLDDDVTVRSATPGKRVRLAWPDGTSVVVGFVTRGRKAVAAVEHERLPTRDAADAARRAWAERFDRLAAVVSSRASG